MLFSSTIVGLVSLPRHVPIVVFATLTVGIATAGCGSNMVPSAPQAGTTTALFVPSDFFPGFGTAWAVAANGPAPAFDANSPYEDPQRGEFFLEAIGPLPIDPNSISVFFPVRYITRTVAPPLSSASLDEDLLLPGESGGGQVVVFVDIPADVPAGDYDLTPQRRVRDPNDLDAWLVPDPRATVYDPNEAWDNSTGPQTNLPLRISILAANDPNADDFSLFKGGRWNFWGAMGADLDALVPLPSVEVLISTETALQGSVNPATAELALLYPSQKLEIFGVALDKNHRSSAIVQWDDDSAALNPGGGCASEQGRLTIDIGDPDQLTERLSIVFKLKVDATGTPPSTTCGWAATGDFALESFALSGPEGELYDPITSAFEPRVGRIR